MCHQGSLRAADHLIILQTSFKVVLVLLSHSLRSLFRCATVTAPLVAWINRPLQYSKVLF